MSVTLQWDADPGPYIVGYRIYYKTGSFGAPYDGTGAHEGPSPIDVGNSTSLTLTGLNDAEIYYFVVTAYDSDGFESAYSHAVSTGPSADPDGDGLTNIEEFRNGTDPSVNNATLADVDTDGIPDIWELLYGIDDPMADPDGDGFSNLVEYLNGANPLEHNQTLPDLDGDMMPDIWEEANGLDPDRNDSPGDPDNDALSNLQEYQNGTDPWVTDSDRDGIGDGTEVAEAANPMSAADVLQISLATSRLQVTDVTPTSFSLVWISNQPASCFANLYTDPGGNNLIKGLTITDESTSHPPARDNGVMKVDVSGLVPETTYYYRIVTESNEGVLVEPASGPLPNVRTEASSIPVTNDLLAHKVLQNDGSTPALGALLLAEVDGGTYPVTGWVGLGVPAPWAYLDLNNVYSQTDHMNLELVGGEDITLVSLGGIMGYRSLSATVPSELGQMQTLTPMPDDEQCILDTIGPLIDTAQLNPAPGVLINNTEPLITAAYSDLYSKIDPVSVKLLVDGADVTDLARVNHTSVKFTPTPLAEGNHTVTLEVADEWGNPGDPFSWTFKVDVTPPMATITQPVDGDYLYPAAQLLRWTVADLNLFAVVLTLNGTSTGLDPAAVEQLIDLAPGLNLIEVAALDRAGNSTSISVQVTLDNDNDGDGVGDYYDPDDDNDLMPDSWETAHGLDPLDPSDAYLDSDEDGHANLTEYTADTDPLSLASFPVVNLAVDHIKVTDVTPDSFSVIWQATEPSSCSLVLYDESGALLSSALIESESELHAPAEDHGVMKARVSGLTANSTYRFQTVTTTKAEGLAVVTPSYAQLLTAVTESASSAVTNDYIKQRIYAEDGSAAEGSLLVAWVEGGDYPVSAWVGEDVASPWARVDLNGIYSKDTHEGLQLVGGERLTLWSFGAMVGNYVNVQNLGAPTGGERPALPESTSLSLQAGYYKDLKIDLNVIALSAYHNPARTAYTLMLDLEEQTPGDTAAVESIRRYNRQTGSWETASWFLGQAAGVDFPIEPGESYLLYLDRDVADVWFEGVALGAAVDLTPGLNLLGLPAAEDGFDYGSYEMLQDLGTETEVSSLKRYSFSEGWQTTSWFFGAPSGAFYSTSKGDGYLVNMRQPREQWRPY